MDKNYQELRNYSKKLIMLIPDRNTEEDIEIQIDKAIDGFFSLKEASIDTALQAAKAVYEGFAKLSEYDRQQIGAEIRYLLNKGEA